MEVRQAIYDNKKKEIKRQIKSIDSFYKDIQNIGLIKIVLKKSIGLDMVTDYILSFLTGCEYSTKIQNPKINVLKCDLEYFMRNKKLEMHLVEHHEFMDKTQDDNLIQSIIL